MINYPRGFARHGDYTIRESQALENHGLAFLELENGSREPVTEEEKQFVAFAVVNVRQKLLKKLGKNIVRVFLAQNVFIPYRAYWQTMRLMITMLTKF